MIRSALKGITTAFSRIAAIFTVSALLTLLLGGCSGSITEHELVCFEGEAQSCVCAGGLHGGQKCRSDGTDWMPCDCGQSADADADKNENENENENVVGEICGDGVDDNDDSACSIDPIDQIGSDNQVSSCSCSFRRYMPMEWTGNVPDDDNYLDPHLCASGNLEPEQWLSYSGDRKAEINCAIARAVTPYACYGNIAYGDYTDNSQCP